MAAALAAISWRVVSLFELEPPMKSLDAYPSKVCELSVSSSSPSEFHGLVSWLRLGSQGAEPNESMRVGEIACLPSLVYPPNQLML